jgi:glycosyltransferase involved in cell wall biosynthesis
VEVVRYRYAPRKLQTLVNHGGIATNLQRAPWKWALVPAFIGAQYFAARRLIRSRRIDAIHAHWLLPQGMVARLLGRRFKVPYVVTSHGGDLFGLRGRALTALKRSVAASSAAMTVVSSAMRDEARRLGLDPPRMDVLPMGVDLGERFVVDPSVARAMDEMLFVGRLVPKKGLCHLLDAMPEILAQRPAAVLNIAGFGPEEQALKAQARRMGIEASIRFLGAVPQRELPRLYRQSSLFVAPFIRDDSGNQEGLPVVLMEAIGCGCPVIVGDVAGVRDLLGEDCDDICVRPTDAKAMASAIVRTLGHPQQAAARAIALRAKAAERVDWTNIAAGYAALISACVAARDVGRS